jgi:hypothetical protein
MRLRPGLHATVIDDIPVFIDEGTGKYFVLRGALAEHYRAFAAGGASPLAIAALATQGLLEEGRGTSTPMLPSAQTDHLTLCGSPSRLLIVKAAAKQLIVTRRIKRGSFTNIIAEIRREIARMSGNRPAREGLTQAEIARAFEQARRIAPAIDRCLPRSIAIAAMLRANGHRPTIVFGVRMPFAAHCWVQCGTRIVSDAIDDVHPLTPILWL